MSSRDMLSDMLIHFFFSGAVEIVMQHETRYARRHFFLQLTGTTGNAAANIVKNINVRTFISESCPTHLIAFMKYSATCATVPAAVSTATISRSMG